DCLTSPHGGFYMTRDVFGSSGDFVTSPEISQLFGEMVGVWCVHTWLSLGRPPRLLLVELGPGRGTLMADLLRGTAAFREFSASLELHLVEISPALRAVQWAALRCTNNSSSSGGSDSSGRGIHTFDRTQVSWHTSLDAVPDGPAPALYIAHEFFDALPVHQFVRDPKRGWLEKMVDVRTGLRMVLSPGPTPASALLVPRRLGGLAPGSAGELGALEVSAVGMAVAEKLAQRIVRHGGAALVVDYGREEPPYGDSLMAIRGHRGVGILDAPGSADLSAWVDFGALKLAPPSPAAVAPPAASVTTSGPVSQSSFLRALGIEMRLQWLMRGATDPGAAESLAAGCARLLGSTESGGMGESYKVMAIHRGDLRDLAGF
ncbi:hypothetical protein VOLCADRAFT_69474, partial [Volvox carteri f. nagariensis]